MLAAGIEFHQEQQSGIRAFIKRGIKAELAEAGPERFCLR
jgi:hypothetical protein